MDGVIKPTSVKPFIDGLIVLLRGKIMIKWEYWWHSGDFDMADMDFVEDKGKEGWELMQIVRVTPVRGRDFHVFILKRPLIVSTKKLQAEVNGC